MLMLFAVLCICACADDAFSTGFVVYQWFAYYVIQPKGVTDLVKGMYLSHWMQ